MIRKLFKVLNVCLELLYKLFTSDAFLYFFWALCLLSVLAALGFIVSECFQFMSLL